MSCRAGTVFSEALAGRQRHRQRQKIISVGRSCARRGDASGHGYPCGETITGGTQLNARLSPPGSPACARSDRREAISDVRGDGTVLRADSCEMTQALRRRRWRTQGTPRHVDPHALIARLNHTGQKLLHREIMAPLQPGGRPCTRVARLIYEFKQRCRQPERGVPLGARGIS
jgi:hypothetical protein